jgi:GH43 family beta-xylosidase
VIEVTMTRTVPTRRRRVPTLAKIAALLLVAAVLPVLRFSAAEAAVQFSSTAVNVGSGRCMEVPGAQTTNGLQLTQATCNSTAQQNFTFVPLSATSTLYNIRTVAAGRCVDVFGASTADNATIIQWSCHTNANQQFRLQPVTVTGQTNTFNVVANHSNKCIVPSGGGTGDNLGLVQLPCSTAGSRVWRVPGFNPGTGGGNTFTNPIRTQGPDPFMVYYNGWYHLVATTWNSAPTGDCPGCAVITMRRSRTLAGIATAPNMVIFNLAQRNSSNQLVFPQACCNMWAPELHLLNGPSGQRWYLYFTASRNTSNYLPTQRIHVLESAGLDPVGPYTFKADLLDPVDTSSTRWELDGSILQLNGQLFLMGTYIDGVQPNFIRPMSNPWTASGTRRRLSTPTLSWETVGGAVNEGPEALQRNGQTFVVFSASHCSTPDYKLGLLRYNGGDPLQQSSWVKSPNPIFQRNNAANVYGPGHGNFFKSPDGTQDWMTYHANSSTSQGCDINRTTRAQQFTWNADGTPNLGVPVGTGVVLNSPSGEPTS